MKNLLKIGLLQAAGLIGYISLVATMMQNGERLFGQMDNIAGPVVFLTLFSFSVLVCALITLAYPFKLFWIKKKPLEALRLVGYTALFLLFFILAMIAWILIY
jgi:hypothetical protein